MAVALLNALGEIDIEAAGRFAYGVDARAIQWDDLPATSRNIWLKLAEAIAAKVRGELIGKIGRDIDKFARTVFNDCHPDCKTTFIDGHGTIDDRETGADYRRSLIAAVNSMANEIESQKRYIKEQGERIKASGGAYEVETLRETFKGLESQLQQAISRADKLEKTSSLWCERFIEATKANTEIGMALVEMMVRHGAEPPDSEQAAVAASETRAETAEEDGEYFRRTCAKCRGTGWNGESTDQPECGQCCGRGQVYVKRGDDRK